MAGVAALAVGVVMVRRREDEGGGEEDAEPSPESSSPSSGSPPAALPGALVRFWPLFQSSADSNGLPPELLAAVAWHESAHTGDPSITGFDGSGRGLMQIDRNAHPEVSDDQAFDANFAIPWAARFLAQLRSGLEARATARDLDPLFCALCGYNAGLTRIRTYLDDGGVNPDARTYKGSYAKTVWGWYQQFSQGSA